MSCFRPMVGIPKEGERTVNGKPVYKWCAMPSYGDYKLKPGCIVVPCGKCLGCRLDYSRRWADRMMLELDTEKKGIFVTLTYNDEHLPISYDQETGEAKGPTLYKKDCQDFMKRLRREFDGKDGHPGPVKIRYFLAGEYGSKRCRPHYHAIIFGLSLEDFPDRVEQGRNQLRQIYWHSDRLTEIWQNGIVVMSDVSWETCAYVARYVVKKATADTGLSPEDIGLDREFCLMSRRPGLGAEYLKQHPDCLEFEQISISTPEGGKQIQIPKYYLRLTDDEMSAKILESRKVSADNKMHMQITSTSLLYTDFLEDEERRKYDAMKALGRGAL